MATFPSELKPSVNSGYSFSNRDDHINRVGLAGGSSIAMRDYSLPLNSASISIQCDRDEKIIFDSFYRDEINKGGIKFIMSLDIGDGLSDYEVKMARGSVSYDGSADPVWIISFSVLIVFKFTGLIVQIDTNNFTGDMFLTLGGVGGYEGSVDWGDGNTTDITGTMDAIISHSYAIEGIYDIEISGPSTPKVSFSDVRVRAAAIEIKSWSSSPILDAFQMFGQNVNIALCSATNIPTFAPNTTAEQMFSNCNKMVGDFSFWDVGNLRSARLMYNQCALLASDFSLWRPSSCTNMQQMFGSMPLFDSNIGGFPMEQVTTVFLMLTGSTGLSTANYDLILAGWAAQDLTDSLSFTTSAQYSAAAVTDRDKIINTDLWTINDGGLEP